MQVTKCILGNSIPERGDKMKTWLFGKEIPYFKPLRHELTDDILQKIEISQELTNAGWTKNSVLELINKKSFLDPHYPDYIRTSDHLITVQHYLVEKIDSIHTQTKELKERLPIFYNDFIKKNALTISDEWKEKGASPLWVLPDLKAEGKFITKIAELYRFETRHFIYDITKKFTLVNVLYKKKRVTAENIEWREGLFVVTTGYGDYSFRDGYTDWLFYLTQKRENPWTNFGSLPEKIAHQAEKLEYRLIINPKIWKELKITKEADMDFFINLFKSDWKNNSFAVAEKDGCSIWAGWRFRYTWDGFILEGVQTPCGNTIQSYEINGNGLYLNKSYSSDLSKVSPEVITDLTVGNLTQMIPEDSLQGIELHPHAILRYEERINEHSYLSVMLQDILKNAYHFGEVVNGAHHEDRRKIETERYGYVISNELVISVWDKLNPKRKKTNRRRNRELRHLEHMIDLFDQIKN